MMHRRPHLPLVVGFIGSIALHIGVIVPVLLLVLTTRGEPDPLHAELHPEPQPDELPDLQEERDKPQLGLDAPNPSSLTWVGYEEYEKHLARLSEVEQAAFRMTETGQSEPRLPAPAQVTPEDAPTEPVGASEPDAEEIEVADDDSPTAEVESTEESEADPTPLTLPSPFDRIGVAEGFLLTESQEDEAGPEVGEMLEDEAASPPDVDAVPAESDETASSAPDTTEPETDEQATDTEPREEHTERESEPVEQSSQDAGSPQHGDPDEGDVSDMESDATSPVEVPPENWRLGRPLAAQGVELKPQRPHFTMLQRLSTSPGNPLVEIRFGSDGVPRQALILTSSGSQSIDSFLESSLYRWRAAGDEIDALDESDTFDVRIQIIFNLRAARRASERSE